MKRLAIAALFAAAACHHSSGSTTTVANQAGQPLQQRKITSDLELLPVDSEAVIGVNFQQLQGSALWQQYVVPKLASVPGIDKFKAICGFDPLSTLQTMSIGMKGLSGDDPTGSIVVHGYSRKTAMSCFDKNVGEAEKDGSKVKVDGDVVMITDKSGKQIAFTFVDDSTALAILGPDAASKDAVKRIVNGTDQGLTGSPAFKEMYDKVNTHDSVWMLINGNALQKAAASMHVKALFGSVNVTDGVTADFRIRVASADEATSLNQMAQAQLASPQIKQFFDKLEVTTEAADLKVVAAIGQQKLQQLMMLLGGAMGGGGGGGNPCGGNP